MTKTGLTGDTVEGLFDTWACLLEGFPKNSTLLEGGGGRESMIVSTAS